MNTQRKSITKKLENKLARELLLNAVSHARICNDENCELYWTLHKFLKSSNVVLDNDGLRYRESHDKAVFIT